MFGRRSYVRYAAPRAPEGTLTIARDALVERATVDEVIAMSRHAGIVGEYLHVDLVERERTLSRRMRIVESRPTVIEGTLWHRIRLEPSDG